MLCVGIIEYEIPLPFIRKLKNNTISYINFFMCTNVRFYTWCRRISARKKYLHIGARLWQEGKKIIELIKSRTTQHCEDYLTWLTTWKHADDDGITVGIQYEMFYSHTQSHPPCRGAASQLPTHIQNKKKKTLETTTN